jgi:hypothetical protein
MKSLSVLLAAVVVLSACGGGGSDAPDAPNAPDAADAPVDAASAASASEFDAPEAAAEAAPEEAESQPRAAESLATTLAAGADPAAGYAGGCYVPLPARAAAVTTPTTVIGNGTPASCTSAAVVSAVAKGGVIKFNCGANPVVIPMTATAKIFNNKPDVVLDGGGKVTLSGRKAIRILYQNTCDPNQVWTSSRCDLQDNPRTTVQNITLVDGNSVGQSYGRADVYGGGAIFVRGGRLKVVNTRFFRNQCPNTGASGGAAIRAIGMSSLSPVYVVGSTFGGAEGYGNTCSAGPAISVLKGSINVYNTLMSHNSAYADGGAIAQDGNTMHLGICGSHLHDNKAGYGGGAIFYTSNDLTGTMSIANSVLHHNVSGRYETAGLPGIFVKAKAGQPVITGTTITR